MGRAVGGVDYYELLEIKPGASQAEIKSAHRSLVKVLHPDAGGSQIMFRLVQEAYETLSDPARRVAYDQRRARDAPEQRRPRPTTPEWETWDEYREETANAEREERPPEPPKPQGFPSGLKPVPLESIPWWRRVNPEAKVHWRPGFGWAQRWFFTVAAVWTALLVATVVPMLASGFSYVAVVVIVPLAYVAVTLAGKATPRFLAVITYIWAAGMVVIGCYALATGGLYAGIAVVLLAAGVFALPPLARWYLASRVTERIFTHEFRTFNLFGAPGTRLLASEDEPVNDCSKGEWMTLDLLSGYLGQIPAARIFHGLAWPGSSRAEVDHAVLCGRKLLLIESKMWPAGHYTSDGNGGLLRDGETFDGASLRLGRTVAAYQMLLPKVQVEGIVLVHTDEPGLVTCRMPDSMPLEVLSPEAFVRHVGARLADEPAVVERDVFLTLLDQVKA